MPSNTNAGVGGTQGLVAVFLTTLLLLSSTVGPVAAASPSADARVHSPDVGFTEAVVTEHRGDVAEIDMVLNGTSSSTLSIRAADGSYQVRAAVYDGNGDGVVTVRYNTFLAGWASNERAAFSVANESDWILSVDRVSPRLSAPVDSGRYNLITSAPGSSTSAVLELTPGDIRGAKSLTVADEHLDPGAVEAVPSAPAFETDRVAAGDYAVAAFNASGVGGQAALTSPPGRNLLYPNDSAASATTTHTIQVSPDNATALNSVTVDYDAGDGGVPPRLAQFGIRDVRHFGVDTDGDGAIETGLERSINVIRSNTEGQISFSLAGAHELGANETLLIQYDARNPSMEGADGVAVTIGNGTYRTRGRALYGPAGQGTLGYGLDLRITDDRPRHAVVAPLSALEYHFDSETDTLYALVDANLSEDPSQSCAITLSRSVASPYVDVARNERSVTSQFEITDRQAKLVAPMKHGQPDVHPGNVTFEATTTLAPASAVAVEVSSSGSNSFLVRASTSVRPDRTVVASVTIPNYSDDQSFRLVVKDGDDVIGGPYGGTIQNGSATTTDSNTGTFAWALS